MDIKGKRTIFRRKLFTAKHEHRRLQAVQQHQYLMQLQKNQDIYPRYDLLSQNNHNNLIVHILRKPKLELKPKNTSQTVSKIQQRIKLLSNYSNKNKKGKTSSSFYSPLQEMFKSLPKNSKIEPILMSKQKYEQQIQRSQSQEHKAKYRPLMTQKSQRQKFNSSNASIYKHKDQKSESDGEKRINILKPIIVYEQEEDKAFCMQEKLRLLYLGSRLTQRNWHKSFYQTNQHSQRQNFF